MIKIRNSLFETDSSSTSSGETVVAFGCFGYDG